MADFSFECISGGQGKFDVIFIHGLNGDPRATWTAEGADQGSNAFWPDWICVDLADANVYLLGYPTDIIAPWLRGEMSLYERSKAVLEHLSSFGIGRRPTAIVAHSLGGLLAKQLLRTGIDASDEAWKAIARSVKLICFLATPHSGSTVASAVKLATPRLASKIMQLLESGGDQLVQLNEWYRNYVSEDILTVEAVTPAPVPILFPNQTPIEIVDAIERGAALIWLSAEAAANAIRQAVEHFMDDAGIAATDGAWKRIMLHNRILEFQKGDAENGDVLLATKWLGNTGSHIGGLTRDHVLDAFDMMELVLNNRYGTAKADLLAKVAAVNAAKGPPAAPPG